VTPDQRTFEKHVKGGPFRSGEERGYWRLISIDWPHAVIAVSAAPRAGSPDEYALRFELTNYPQDAPTAEPWDFDADAPLPVGRWPNCGGQVFRPEWKPSPSQFALYIPCDRLAYQGHGQWATEHKADVWNPTRGITHYLRIVRRFLHQPGYTGVRR
jgi:hypothetical protein